MPSDSVRTLVVPAGAPRVAAFSAEARVSGRRLAYLAVSGAEGQSRGEPSLAWNPLSFASARAAVMEAETAFGGRFDELVLIADPPSEMHKLSSLAPSRIESAALEWAAGWALLLRETLKRFEEKSEGRIVMVIPQAERGPLGSMAAGALEGLASGLLLTGSPCVKFSLIKDESGQADILARHIIKTLEHPASEAGKIQRLGSRSGFFR